jgi:crossover junction endodeoxyribonuclease RuvC
MSRILGIDPGASGALVLLSTDTGSLEIYDMPTVEIKRGQRNVRQVNAGMLVDIIKQAKPDAAFVESVHAMPGQGVSSMFAFGRALGLLEGALAGLGVPFTLIPPREWTAAMRVKGGKDGSRSRVADLFPSFAKEFARVKDDGRADAALIAAYGAKSL